MGALSLARLGKGCYKVTGACLGLRQNSSSRNMSQARGHSLTACLRVRRPESESLSQLCLWSMWVEALLVTMRLLRTQIRNCRIWSDWKCNGLLPLVVLALSRPEEALWWLLPQWLRYSFCQVCGSELERLTLMVQGQKSLFPWKLALHHPFCYTQKGHLDCCSPLYDSLLLMWSGLSSEVHRHMEDGCLPY